MTPIYGCEWSMCKMLWMHHIDSLTNVPAATECNCLPRTSFMPYGCPHKEQDLWAKANYKSMQCAECTKCLRCKKLLGWK